MSEILPRPDREKIPDTSETNLEQELTVPPTEQQEVEIGADEAQILSQIEARREMNESPRQTLESIANQDNQQAAVLQESPSVTQLKEDESPTSPEETPRVDESKWYLDWTNLDVRGAESARSFWFAQDREEPGDRASYDELEHFIAASRQQLKLGYVRRHWQDAQTMAEKNDTVAYYVDLVKKQDELDRRAEERRLSMEAAQSSEPNKTEPQLVQPLENTDKQEVQSDITETAPEYPEGERTDQSTEDAAVSEKELNFRAELIEAFPELNNEKGEAVQEALVAILRHEKVTVGEIKTLFRDGFRFFGEADMPEGWQQTNAAGKREKMFANTNIDIRGNTYTIDLYEDLFKPEHASSRTAILAHELGEMIHVRAVARADENEVVRREPVVDLEAYKQLVAGRKLEWSDPYVRREQGKKHFYDEMISDDIGDYLNSDSPQGMLRERLHRFPSKERMLLETALDRHLDGSATEEETQAILPMLEEAEVIYTFIDKEWKSKKDLLKPIKNRGEVEEEEMESEFMSETQPQSDMKTDTRVVDKWIDWLFNAGQKAA